jgi:hypothetical protein
MKRAINGLYLHPKTRVDTASKLGLDNRIQNVAFARAESRFDFSILKTANSDHHVPIAKEFDRCPVTNFVERSPHA